MITGVIAFFYALPAIVALISRLGNLLDSLVQYSNQNNLNGWIDDLEKAMNKLEQSKTPEERLDAAQFLVGTVRGLGPR